MRTVMKYWFKTVYLEFSDINQNIIWYGLADIPIYFFNFVTASKILDH